MARYSRGGCGHEILRWEALVRVYGLRRILTVVTANCYGNVAETIL